ncbi:biotin transporter BioY ['Paenibacillus yunnanensis' Narsing Rao et al. 2020]|uniref:biotin transporter BioY n=1 Tax=Paenibacillus tengchongensis TaxID=2608684 RepID=UPI00124F0510|nr:biotin transporter BioY [Paenibacillus tengchongensis]
MNRWTTRGVIFSALFAGIMIALSYFKIALPISTVPVTLQTLAVMLAGSVLGARYGMLAVLIVVGLCAAGFPVLGGSGGIAMLSGYTAGYILSWPFAALLIGLFAQRIGGKHIFVKLLTVNFVFGALFVYPGGVWWLAHSMGIGSLGQALTAGMWPFLPGDLLKSVLCAAVVTAVWKVYPIERILRSGRNSWSEEEGSGVQY